MDDAAVTNDLSGETDEDASQLKIFWVVVGIFSAYAIALIGLAYATSNPVLVNPRQIENSPLIFVGQVQAANDLEATFQIEEILKGSWDRETILVKGFLPGQISPGESWVVPVIFVTADAAKVTPLNLNPEAKASSLIYPADAKTIDNLKSRLSSDENSP